MLPVLEHQRRERVQPSVAGLGERSHPQQQR